MAVQIDIHTPYITMSNSPLSNRSAAFGEDVALRLCFGAAGNSGGICIWDKLCSQRVQNFGL